MILNTDHTIFLLKKVRHRLKNNDNPSFDARKKALRKEWRPEEKKKKKPGGRGEKGEEEEEVRRVGRVAKRVFKRGDACLRRAAPQEEEESGVGGGSRIHLLMISSRWIPAINKWGHELLAFKLLLFAFGFVILSFLNRESICSWVCFLLFCFRVRTNLQDLHIGRGTPRGFNWPTYVNPPTHRGESNGPENWFVCKY